MGKGWPEDGRLTINSQHPTAIPALTSYGWPSRAAMFWQ